MNDMAKSVFFDVEKCDEALVLSRVPDTVFADAGLTGDALVGACEGAEIICTFITTSFRRDVIERLPSLKLICTRSVGYDHIDLAACAERGIVVCNVPDYGSHVIAEHAFALLLSRLRHVTEAAARVRSGSFDYHGLRGTALKDKTIGILGTGKIGRHAAQIAKGFGMKILANDMYPVPSLEETIGLKYVPLEHLLHDSDIISVHVPSTPETTHMLNDAAFAQMKKGVFLVNTARGAIVDQSALLRALNDGTVAGALLDVVEHEQQLGESAQLIAHPNVTATPHIAFYADDSMQAMYADALASIDEWRAGSTPKHAVATPAH